jgi:hypothetical protein
VLHHIEDRNREIKDLQNIEFPTIKEVFHEFHRVLKPGGILMVNYTFPEQNRGYWWIDRLTSHLIDFYKKVTPEVSQFKLMLGEIGFIDTKDVKITDVPYKMEQLLDINMIKSKDFRDGDSSWALLSAEELDEAMKKLDKMIEEYKGREDEFVEEIK